MGREIRQSNFELLRIISMFGVLTSHSLMAMYDLHTINFSICNELRVFIMNISCLAVNCFVMISGYFQIRQTWKGFIGLLSTCVFWTFICCCLAFYYSEISYIELFKKICFPLTESGLWFLRTYFALFLIAPILNSGINNLGQEQLRYSCFMVLIIDIYIGYMHQSPEVSIDGYHLIHFITLYILASTIRRNINDIKIGTKLEMAESFERFRKNTFICDFFLRGKMYKIKTLSIIILAVFILMTLLHMIKMMFPPIAIIYSLRYNSPILMVASIITFIMFSRLKIQSIVINWISNSVLSVYLISSLPFIGPKYYKILVQINNSYSGISALILIAGFMMTFYFLCILSDKIRKYIMRPIEEKVTQIINERKINNHLKI